MPGAWGQDQPMVPMDGQRADMPGWPVNGHYPDGQHQTRPAKFPCLQELGDLDLWLGIWCLAPILSSSCLEHLDNEMTWLGSWGHRLKARRTTGRIPMGKHGRQVPPEVCTWIFISSSGSNGSLLSNSCLEHVGMK